MDLEFKSKKIKKQCEEPREAQKVYGSQIGFKLTLRVNELRAATNLLDISKASKVNGFHQLDGDRDGEFAVTLVHPHRLVFKPILTKEEQIENLSEIKVLRIEEVIDYHGKTKRK